MSSLATSANTVSSSDWILLSEFLCPNYSGSHNVKIDPIKDDTKGTTNAWTSSDDGPYHAVFTTGHSVTGNELMFQNKSDDIRSDNFVYEPFQVSISNEPFQSLWSTDCPFISQINSSSDFTSKFKQSWDAMQLSPTVISAYKFKETPIPTADVGIQTMATSISWLPIAGHRHTVPWGLKTDKPSPLTDHNGIVDHSYNSNKRKFDDCTAWEESTWPPKKKTALDNQDYGYLNSLFDYLKSPSINYGYVAIDEEGVNQTPIPCKYEGFVQVDHSNLAIRNVAANTIHVPMRRLPHQCTRSKSWRHAAKQFIREEDRVNKRGSRQGTKEDRTKRMIDTIMAYYCR